MINKSVNVWAYNFEPICLWTIISRIAASVQSNGTVLPAVPTFPDTFQVRVEANILEMNKTIVGEEFHDMNKRAALRTITNNSENYMILDYYNGQLFYDVSKCVMSLAFETVLLE